MKWWDRNDIIGKSQILTERQKKKLLKLSRLIEQITTQKLYRFKNGDTLTIIEPKEKP